MESKKGGELIGKRPEAIIEARFNLTKRQNDILDMVFASIENDDNLKYQIDISKYSKLYNIQDKSNIFGDLKRTVKTFEGKGFSITKNPNTKEENRIYFSWFSSIEYLNREGKIEIELGQKLKSIMLNAKKACFYKLKYSLNFNNIYSKRIYYYLKSFENTGWRIDNLDELRNKLECPKSYKVYYDFKRYVLKPAYEEINGNSDISFEYEEIKIRGKVKNLKFYIKSNKEIEKDTSVFPTPDDEVSAALIEPEKETPIKKIMAIMYDSKITSLEAKKIYDSSKKNLEIIKKVYDDGRNQKIPNFIGWMISMVKPGVYVEPKKNYAKGEFNNCEQRKYDGSDGGMTISELEKKLLGRDKLGWDKKETIETTGEEYQQSNYK